MKMPKLDKETLEFFITFIQFRLSNNHNFIVECEKHNQRNEKYYEALGFEKAYQEMYEYALDNSKETNHGR